MSDNFQQMEEAIANQAAIVRDKKALVQMGDALQQDVNRECTILKELTKNYLRAHGRNLSVRARQRAHEIGQN